jgi:hypothetical protein
MMFKTATKKSSTPSCNLRELHEIGTCGGRPPKYFVHITRID